MRQLVVLAPRHRQTSSDVGTLLRPVTRFVDEASSLFVLGTWRVATGIRECPLMQPLGLFRRDGRRDTAVLNLVLHWHSIRAGRLSLSAICQLQVGGSFLVNDLVSKFDELRIKTLVHRGVVVTCLYLLSSRPVVSQYNPLIV